MIVIVIISFFVVLIFGLMLRNVFDKNARKRRIARNGIEAKAVLLNVSYNRSSINELPEVNLRLQVYPETGRNFVAEIPVILHREDEYQVGDSLTVKYNPVNANELIISPN